MVADLMVPPLMMLLALSLAGVGASVILAFAGGITLPAIIFFGLELVLIVTLALAWITFGREALRPVDLLALPCVFFGKFLLYLAMWRGRGAGWVRTDRN